MMAFSLVLWHDEWGSVYRKRGSYEWRRNFVYPQKTCEEFQVEDYDCLILPGCSDTRQAIQIRS